MKRTTKVLITSFAVNLCLSFAKIIVGFLGTSQSLIVDGMHSFSDLVTDVVAIVGGVIAYRPADDEHPFGHGRLEYITSLFISIVILVLGFSLIKESIVLVNQKPDIRILWVVLPTIIIKFLVANYLLRNGKKLKNHILISSGKESFTDVISSVLVLIVVACSQFQDKCAPLMYVDRLGGIIIGILIMITGVCLLKDNISILIGRRELDQNIIGQVQNCLNNIGLPIKDIILIKYGPYYRATVILLVNEKETIRSFKDISYKIKIRLKECFFNIRYIDVQVDLDK